MATAILAVARNTLILIFMTSLPLTPTPAAAKGRAPPAATKLKEWRPSAIVCYDVAVMSHERHEATIGSDNP